MNHALRAGTPARGADRRGERMTGRPSGRDRAAAKIALAAEQSRKPAWAMSKTTRLGSAASTGTPPMTRGPDDAERRIWRVAWRQRRAWGIPVRTALP
jgi:hypothetical protein